MYIYHTRATRDVRFHALKNIKYIYAFMHKKNSKQALQIAIKNTKKKN